VVKYWGTSVMGITDYEIKSDIDLNILVDKYGFKEYKYYYKRKTNGTWIKVYKDGRYVWNPTGELSEIEDLYKDGLLQEIDWVPFFWNR